MTEVVPKLFDDFDRLTLLVSQDGDEAQRTLWELSTLRSADEVAVRTVKFSTIAQWLQMPNVDVLQETEVLLEGKLNQREREVIESKVKWARYWLDNYAGSDEKFEVQSELPKVSLSEAQQKYVGELAQKLAEAASAEEYQTAVYDTAKAMELSSRDAFAAIYMLFLNRQSGPKAGWLLYSLDRDFVLGRLQQGSQASSH